MNDDDERKKNPEPERKPPPPAPPPDAPPERSTPTIKEYNEADRHGPPPEDFHGPDEDD